MAFSVSSPNLSVVSMNSVVKKSYECRMEEKMQEEPEQEENMELGHEPVPGYKTVFFLALAVGLTYLIIILANSL